MGYSLFFSKQQTTCTGVLLSTTRKKILLCFRIMALAIGTIITHVFYRSHARGMHSSHCLSHKNSRDFYRSRAFPGNSLDVLNRTRISQNSHTPSERNERRKSKSVFNSTWSFYRCRDSLKIFWMKLVWWAIIGCCADPMIIRSTLLGWRFLFDTLVVKEVSDDRQPQMCVVWQFLGENPVDHHCTFWEEPRNCCPS